MKSGDFLAVVGQVGCGKSTFLYSAMDETILLRGSRCIRGSMAYVEQEPFIFSATVADNITFGEDYDEEKLERAIKASQLSRDMETFGKGANTIIGERGVNISGGQKARISLARAIYSDADIILLDDPLSAVDPEVANNIFNEIKNGVFKDKLVVLVTHQLQFLEQCPKILLLKDGKVVKIGSYQEIVETGFNIKDILDSYNQALKAREDDDSKKTVFKAETANGSPQKLKENGQSKQAEAVVNKGDSTAAFAAGKEKTPKENEKKQEDLVVAEEKIEGGVGFRDYQNLFSFSVGTSGIVLYFAISVICSLL